ncbi:hypothetical protein TEHAB4_18000 [Tetragenococcus halophilus]|uniref:hypothetical protein n=1 Tax=Tetragenococcus halophilus TaxID=51669 RepID=UPI001595BCAA|nr:hypothetical protein [Tetragenococcus halophilus]MDN6626205.1 hypothetical protein [Pisciglobus halotolerans]GMG62054.1 hypothetical protein TEHAB4_18000 [Tetragenococcus halophilus]
MSQELYARPIDTEFVGLPVRVHFYWDPQKTALNEKALFDNIQRKEHLTPSSLGKIEKEQTFLKKYFTVEKDLLYYPLRED